MGVVLAGRLLALRMGSERRSGETLPMVLALADWAWGQSLRWAEIAQRSGTRDGSAVTDYREAEHSLNVARGWVAHFAGTVRLACRACSTKRRSSGH